MRKPENREKFKVALATIIQFYGRRDIRMVAEVMIEEAAKAKALLDRTSPVDRRSPDDQRERNRTDRVDLTDGEPTIETGDTQS